MPSSRKRSAETKGSYATTCMPSPAARRATCCPMRPNPSTPSVFPASSMPPWALLQRCMRLRDVARERDQQPDRVLGRRDDGRFGRVRDDDPAPRRRLDVDVVDADTGSPDHPQAHRAPDQLRRQLRRRPHDDRVVAVDDLREVALGILVHVEPRPEQIEPGRGDRFADEDARRQLRQILPAAPRRRRGTAQEGTSPVPPSPPPACHE